MSYPFGPFPTFRELVERLGRDFGVECEKSRYCLEGSRGVTELYFLRRRLPGGTWLVRVLPEHRPDDPVTPDVLRTIAGALGIDVRDLGLDLG